MEGVYSQSFIDLENFNRADMFDMKWRIPCTINLNILRSCITQLFEFLEQEKSMISKFFQK